MHATAKLALVALFALSLEGCATSMTSYDEPSLPSETDSAIAGKDSLLQCVPYAREQSGIDIYGDAYTWWDKAAGKYPRGSLPAPGAVMVLHNYAGAKRGHLAVVRQVVGPARSASTTPTGSMTVLSMSTIRSRTSRATMTGRWYGCSISRPVPGAKGFIRCKASSGPGGAIPTPL